MSRLQKIDCGNARCSDCKGQTDLDRKGWDFLSDTALWTVLLLARNLYMRLLQRYITIELLRVFIMVLMAISVLLVFVGLFQQASENGLGAAEVVQILPYVLLSLFPITIPAAMLLTVTVVYGRMAGDKELTVARAAGVHLYSLLWPSFLLGAALSVSALFLTDQVIPWAIDRIQHTVLMKMEKIFLDQLRNDHQFTSPGDGLVITVMDVEQKTLIRPTIRYTSDDGDTYTIQAETANIRFNLEERTAVVKIVGGRANSTNGWNGQVREEEYHFPLPLLDKQQKARHMASEVIEAELDKISHTREKQRSLKTISTAMSLTTGRFEEFTQPKFQELFRSDVVSTERRNKLRAEYHSRYALAGSCFFFVLIGSPYTIMQAKKQFLTTFFMVFMPIIFLYYPIVMLSMNQAKNGVLPPQFVMWTANVVAAGVGVHLLRKLMKN